MNLIFIFLLSVLVNVTVALDSENLELFISVAAKQFGYNTKIKICHDDGESTLALDLIGTTLDFVEDGKDLDQIMFAINYINEHKQTILDVQFCNRKGLAKYSNALDVYLENGKLKKGISRAQNDYYDKFSQKIRVGISEFQLKEFYTAGKAFGEAGHLVMKCLIKNSLFDWLG